MEIGVRFRAGFIGEDFHIIAVLFRWPETKDRIGADPFFRNHLVEHLIRIAE